MGGTVTWAEKPVNQTRCQVVLYPFLFRGQRLGILVAYGKWRISVPAPDLLT